MTAARNPGNRPTACHSPRHEPPGGASRHAGGNASARHSCGTVHRSHAVGVSSIYPRTIHTAKTTRPVAAFLLRYRADKTGRNYHPPTPANWQHSPIIQSVKTICLVTTKIRSVCCRCILILQFFSRFRKLDPHTLHADPVADRISRAGLFAISLFAVTTRHQHRAPHSGKQPHQSPGCLGQHKHHDLLERRDQHRTPPKKLSPPRVGGGLTPGRPIMALP